jgi:hypothetical protein
LSQIFDYYEGEKRKMNGLPNEIFRRWGHSFEEDTGDIRVYRPEDYEFPRARGRDGLEFRPDGTFIDWTVGRGDASEGIYAKWNLEDLNHLRIDFKDNIRPSRHLEILRCDAEVLKIRAIGSFN